LVRVRHLDLLRGSNSIVTYDINGNRVSRSCGRPITRITSIHQCMNRRGAVSRVRGEFRHTIAPLLGSPYDERLYSRVY
jgi:hypothetical protein